MVRSDSITNPRLKKSWPSPGLAAPAIATTLLNLLFNLCEACEATMSCIPPSAFSAGRIREAQQRDMKMANVKTGPSDPPNKYYRTKFMELSPLKYNSKLMNSIWGFYNRYSPHNVKKVTDANCSSPEMQSPAAVSPREAAPARAAPWPVWAVWAAGSQSH